MSRVIKKPPVSKESYLVKPPPLRRPTAGGSPASAPESTQSEAEKAFESELKRLQQEAQAQVDAMLQEAAAEKESQLRAAQTEAEQIRTTARKEATQEGLEEGRKQGLEEIREAKATDLEQFLGVTAQLLESMHEEKEKFLRSCESGLLDLACTIAGKIVRHEIERDQEAVLRVVASAIDLATEKEKITIRVHPDDHQWVQEHCDQLLESHDVIKELHFEDDARIARGGCVLETEAGNVDARLERQMNEVERKLKEGS